jgi:hypothetical protein
MEILVDLTNIDIEELAIPAVVLARHGLGV